MGALAKGPSPNVDTSAPPWSPATVEGGSAPGRKQERLCHVFSASSATSKWSRPTHVFHFESLRVPTAIMLMPRGQGPNGVCLCHLQLPWGFRQRSSRWSGTPEGFKTERDANYPLFSQLQASKSEAHLIHSRAMLFKGDHRAWPLQSQNDSL